MSLSTSPTSSSLSIMSRFLSRITNEPYGRQIDVCANILGQSWRYRAIAMRMAHMHIMRDRGRADRVPRPDRVCFSAQSLSALLGHRHTHTHPHALDEHMCGSKLLGPAPQRCAPLFLSGSRSDEHTLACARARARVHSSIAYIMFMFISKDRSIRAPFGHARRPITHMCDVNMDVDNLYGQLNAVLGYPEEKARTSFFVYVAQIVWHVR